MRDERLALIFSFDDAPQELKDAAVEHKDNWLKYNKANHQADLWRLEKSKSKDLYDRSAEKFDRLLKKWDPAGLKSKDLEDISE